MTRSRRRAIRNSVISALAVLALGACGGDSGGDSSATPTSAASGPTAPGDGRITIEGFSFKPATVTVKAGTTVTWTNLDTDAHSVKPTDGSFSTSPEIKNGAPAFEHTFEEAGTFAYICGIHNSMSGTVVVV